MTHGRLHTLNHLSAGTATPESTGGVSPRSGSPVQNNRDPSQYEPPPPRRDFPNMDSNLLNPRMAPKNKSAQVEEAKKMQRATADAASKDGMNEPPYEFLELIGKGTFGRVYKSKNRQTQQVVAVKVIEVDMPDYEAPREAQDDSIQDFLKETAILRQLRDSQAQNVNVLYDAFPFSSQLWIVSEYCPGGSVHTLMKANPEPGLEERFIIPIARELGVALQSIHAAGVIHRDIKCANILITEDGRLQLCDFGIAGVLTSNHDKRSTLIGTPNWMPPELIAGMISRNEFVDVQYGPDVDWWAFGCVIYEMATGMPPYGHIPPDRILESPPPRLEGDDYSSALQDLVAFCLPKAKEDRPTGDQVMQHEYIENTAVSHPTKQLTALLERFVLWEQAGGHRQSLFTAYGAAGPIIDDASSSDSDDDWNFSTSNDFERRFSQANMNRFSDPFQNETMSPSSDSMRTPTAPAAPAEKDPYRKRLEDLAVTRGQRHLDKIFNRDGAEYQYGDTSDDINRRLSDLPFRNLGGSDNSGDRTTMIDLDMADFATPSIDLGQATLKPNRRTQWYGSFEDESDDQMYFSEDQQNQTARRATRDWKMPLMTAPVENPNRKTMEWSFPKADADDSSANEDAGSLSSRRRRRPAPKGLNLPSMDAAEDPYQKRTTRDWKFPSMGDEYDLSTDPDVFASQSTMNRDSYRRGITRAATEPVGSFDGFDFSTPESPNRESMIDLDLALDLPTDISRPLTASSATGSTFTDATSGNPFDLEDQVDVSVNSNRASMHMKSQSEPAVQRFINPDTGEREYGSDDPQYLNERGFPRAASAKDLSGHFQRHSPSGLQKKWAPQKSEFDSQFPSFDSGDTSAAESTTSSSSPSVHTFDDFDSHTIVVDQDDLRKSMGFTMASPPQPPHPSVLSNEADEDRVTAELQRLAMDFNLTLEAFAFKYDSPQHVKKASQ